MSIKLDISNETPQGLLDLTRTPAGNRYWPAIEILSIPWP